jgi:glycosyltransferase involved in cell wall biosynthesis
VTDLAVFLPYGPEAASARIRVFGWLEHLGLPASVHSYVGRANARAGTLLRRPLSTADAERRLRLAARGPHGRVLLHREASPLSDGAVEERILRSAAFSVYDIDDATQWDWGDGHPVRRFIPKGAKTIRAAHHADRVIAANNELAEWASCWARDVVVIPSCVSPESYEMKSTYDLSDPPRLGWIGSPATEHYLRSIADALLEVHRRTGARLTVISSGHRSLGAFDEMVDRVRWTLSGAEWILARWDVGIMPLAEGLYERGKAGYKLLQYGAARLPTVGSPVGVNSEILAAMGAPSPRSVGEWLDALIAILEASTSSREELAARARRVVEDGFSYATWERRWRESVMPEAA